ncbi:Rft-1-domain-containing protein [Rhizophagus clarus]|uniref:Man(5)GlcNAc(2)-PP-dolichol translocation protein RFT1 n=1 Tax=Rhizophagus clarus TaxID=94130 RepID=A0A8H3QFZ3_9GLOM|nr:Rft-1-domain-containing protein [Rhizophagus clarus]
MSTIKRKNFKEITKEENKIIENETHSELTTPSQKDVSQILSSSVAGASSLVMLQLISRLTTFVLHQVVLRYTDPATFGIASVQLELLLATILFLSREGFRCALLRGGGDTIVVDYDGKSSDKSQGNSKEESLSAPYYVVSVILYGLAAFIELIIEPLYVAAMNNLIFTLRVRCEIIGVFLRCIITFAMTVMGAPKNGEKGENAYGILAFAVAQIAFSLVLMIGYVGYFISYWDIQLLKPRKLQDERQKVFWFDEHLFNLAKTFTKQSLLKHVLTEGDKMLIAILSDPVDQGIYAFVFNYGSLIVRILFQPLEETTRTLFSKLLTCVDIPNEVDDKQKESESETCRALITSLQVLTTLIKFHILLGLLFIGFATNYTGTLIDLLVGSVWSKTPAPLVLSVYCIYVPIMGINGVTEAFVAAVASEETLSRLNYWLIAFSAGFVGAGVIFMKGLSAGAVGLVAANVVNLSTRILWSWNFIRSYFLMHRDGKQKTNELKRMLSLSNLLPNNIVILSFSSAWIITYFSNQLIGWETLDAKIKHIAVGGVCAIVVAGITYLQEKEFIRDSIKLIRGNKASNKQE